MEKVTIMRTKSLGRMPGPTPQKINYPWRPRLTRCECGKWAIPATAAILVDGFRAHKGDGISQGICEECRHNFK